MRTGLFNQNPTLTYQMSLHLEVSKIAIALNILEEWMDYSFHFAV